MLTADSCGFWHLNPTNLAQVSDSENILLSSVAFHTFSFICYVLILWAQWWQDRLRPQPQRKKVF